MIRARRAPRVAPPGLVRDPAILEAYLEDASGAPPGRASALARPESEAEAAALLRQTAPGRTPILFQAARTSLTAGAIPRDELVISVEKMATIGPVEASVGSATVRVEPGVRLDTLRETLARAGWYYPPVPTYEQAMIGGTVATNAGGAATFKYGVTRQWVRGLTVILTNGELLELERGQAMARRGERFEIALSNGDELIVPLPSHRLPGLRKTSAGYHSADPLDLVDLFVGSEGTLGLISSVTLALVPLPAAVVTGLVFLEDGGRALSLAADLRSAAIRARDRGDLSGPDVRAIESIDEQGLELLRSTGEASRLRIDVPDSARAALLFETELSRHVTNEVAQDLVLQVLEGRSPMDGSGLARLFAILRDRGALGGLDFAFPEDADRALALKEFREAVPRTVGEILRERRREHPEVKKVAGDLIVPFDRVDEMMHIYEDGFRSRGLEFAIWGHLSDGNLHPNALPRDAADVRQGVGCMLEFAERAIELGGCPLSEHGVGRDPLKQEILSRFVGSAAIDRMREIKRALDPDWRLAPGVLFPVP